MRNFPRLAIVSAATLSLLVGFSVPAFGTDYASAKDFWKGAAKVTPNTLYAVSTKVANKLGINPGTPPTNAQLEMLCAGKWNVGFDYSGASGGANTYQASNQDCFPDFGYAGTPGSWPFTAKGKKFTMYYNGCSSTPAGANDPPIDQCASGDIAYYTTIRLPAVGNKSATTMHIMSDGLTRIQLRTFIRSLQPVR